MGRSLGSPADDHLVFVVIYDFGQALVERQDRGADARRGA